jgi:hypothetical protein
VFSEKKIKYLLSMFSENNYYTMNIENQINFEEEKG